MLTTKQTSSCLERPFEVTLCGLAKDVECNDLRVVERLEPHERLDEQRLRVLEVEMEEKHHAAAHVDCTRELGGLLEVVVPNCYCDELTRFFCLEKLMKRSELDDEDLRGGKSTHNRAGGLNYMVEGLELEIFLYVESKCPTTHHTLVTLVLSDRCST